MGRQDSTSWIKGRDYRQAKTASKSMFRALIVLSLLSAVGSGVALIQHWQAQAQAQTEAHALAKDLCEDRWLVANPWLDDIDETPAYFEFMAHCLESDRSERARGLVGLVW